MIVFQISKSSITVDFELPFFLNDKNLPAPVAGDTRCAENSVLSSWHTAFARFHNKIADELKSVMDDKTDEEIFLEARQINIGIYQNIIFNEWLPTVFGEENFAQIPELQLSSSGRKRRRADDIFGRRETPGSIKSD
mgnify:FL=1